ncbi:uncharacterized protein LOC141657862 isoform X1 [Silene latifolia]|uniref:uncharacterized protein LOC141657862 isoform X1 n=1 Tax=Silene latifolia TaxID=37657 RepID=UPI003D782106
MVTINGEECSLITCCRQRESRQQSRKYVPEEIWLEIFSRLPFKSLFISRCVCKSWRNIIFTLENIIDTDPMYIPVCGLFLACLEPIKKRSFSYICLRTKTCSITHFDSPENNLYYSSGFESGLLSDLSFDFSIIYNFTDHARDSRFVSFIPAGGLIVVALDDYNWEVHNPTTKQIYVVPTSPRTAKHGFECRNGWELPGHVIKLPSRLTEQRCGFIFVIFWTKLRVMEVYYSMTRMWREYDLTLDAEVMASGNYWLAFNYVVCDESGVLCMYLLTDKGVGVTVKFEGSTKSVMDQYCFPLPQVIVGNYINNSKIWGCENSLYLSYYNDTGLWIWKAGCTQIDAWVWVPMLEINPARQLCKPVAREHLSKVVLNARARVMVLACHPDVAIIYLMVKSSVFAYNLNTDTLDMICDVKDEGDEHTNFIYSAVTFKPFLNFMDAGEELPSNGCECR